MCFDFSHIVENVFLRKVKMHILYMKLKQGPYLFTLFMNSNVFNIYETITIHSIKPKLFKYFKIHSKCAYPSPYPLPQAFFVFSFESMGSEQL